MTQELDSFNAHHSKTLNTLKTLQKGFVYEAPLEPTKTESLFENYPYIAKLIRESMRFSSSVSSVDNTPLPDAVNTSFHIGGLLLNVIDFLRVPFLYLSAFILKKPIPFTLNNNARWFYSGLVLSLVIAGFVVPGAGTVISLATAAIALGVSVALLGKTISDRIQFVQQLKKVNNEFTLALSEMEQINREALALTEKLAGINGDGQFLHILYSSENINEQVDALSKRATQQQELLNTLHTQQQDLHKKIESIDLPHVLDRGLSIALTATAIASFILILTASPVVGWAIMTGLGAFGMIYVGGRGAISLFQSINAWLDKQKPAEEQQTSQESELQVEHSIVPSNRTIMQGLEKVPAMAKKQIKSLDDEETPQSSPQAEPKTEAATVIEATLIEEEPSSAPTHVISR